MSNMIDDSFDKLLAYFRHTFLGVVINDVIEIPECRIGKSDLHLLLDTQPLLDLSKGHSVTRSYIHQALRNGSYKCQFFGIFFVLIEPLHDGDTAPTTGQQYRSTRLVDLIYHLSRVNLEVR